jgi:chemotaxis protein CheC
MTWPFFKPFHMDVLKEIGNIGAGHAATSLSQILGQPVHMQIPEVRIVSFDELAELAGGDEQVVVATCLYFHGDIEGYMFFILGEDPAWQLAQMVFKQPETSGSNDLYLSAVQEIGNILCSSYLSALADFTKLNIYPSVPELAIDMAAAIISYGLLEAGKVGDQAVVIETCILDSNRKEMPVDGHFLLLLHPDSYSTMFKALGVNENGKYPG